MKQKRFSLQTVLDLRVKAREQAEDALAKAIRDRDIAAARCAEAIARLEELTRMITGERFAAYVREQGWNAINAQRDLLRTLEARLLQAEKKVSDQREILIAADRDQKLVEKLKEKWSTAQDLEFARYEEKQLEDFVTAARFLQSATT
jgi:flagellar export protein FliJ